MHFGPIEFDRHRRWLARSGSEAHLTPKAFDLLVLLIDASPRVVTKAELHARLWPNGIVSDATLIGLIKEVRRALGDTVAHKRMIRTVNRVGYAFEAQAALAHPCARATRASCPSAEGATHDVARITRWLVLNGRRVSLEQSENVIGRDECATIHLDHSTVSRRHARILLTEKYAMLEECGSKNGTWISAERVTAPVRLHDGDQLYFGHVRATYREACSAQSTSTQLSSAQFSPIVSART